MAGTAIVTDSAACLSAASVREHQIEVVPYQLVWDGQVYLDGQDLTPGEFYRKFRSCQTYPTTATPTAGHFAAAYRRAAERADSIAVLVLPQTLTSTYLVARQAAEGFDIPIQIVDAGTAACAQGFVVLAAARAANGGASLQQVVAAAEDCRARVGMFFAMETLEHLRRGGRIGRAATLLGARLSIQPVLTLAGGQVQPVAVHQRRRSAIDRVVKEVHRAVKGRPIRAAIFHADVPAEAAQLADRVQHEFHCVECAVSEFTPVMGAHTGPGIIGICYGIEGAR